MSHFATTDVLITWQSKLVERFTHSCRLIEREYTYINKRLPFKALNMGKKHDEYFLNAENRKIPIENLLNDLNLLVIKHFQTIHDLSYENKQAEKATSRADIYIGHENVEIVVELEVFKDKPFSNLIYIPEICSPDRRTPFHFIHCFAPERLDKEAELTRRIGCWLQRQPTIENYEYVSYMMPPLPDSIKYLLPNKKGKKPKSYQCLEDRTAFHQYINEFCEQRIIPKVSNVLDSRVMA